MTEKEVFYLKDVVLPEADFLRVSFLPDTKHILVGAYEDDGRNWCTIFLDAEKTQVLRDKLTEFLEEIA